MSSLTVIIVAFLLGLGLLYYGANWLVAGGSAIAVRACISPLVVGLTLGAFGTSAPELFVSTGAAISDLGDVCVGNVVGSNIFNVFGILGISALVRPVRIEGMDIVDFGMAIAVSVILWQIMRAKTCLDRRDGFHLLILYALYLTWLIASCRAAI